MSSLVGRESQEKIKEEYNRMKEIKDKEKLVKQSDLPVADGFIISPSLD